MYVKGRETENGATVFKLVPPSTMLYTKIAETFPKKYHVIGGSPGQKQDCQKAEGTTRQMCIVQKKDPEVTAYCHGNSWI